MNGKSATQVNQANVQAMPQVTHGVLQRKCACGQHTFGGKECAACSKEDEPTLKRSAIKHNLNPGVSPHVPGIVHDVLRSPGQPLDARSREFMEPRFGRDFSNVRVHTDARAVTRGDSDAIQPKLSVGTTNDPLEHEADRVADQAVNSEQPHGQVAAPHIQSYRNPISTEIEAPASVGHVLSGAGRPLEPAVRRDMETRLGHDFSRVRVHSDDTAAQSARTINAEAYTMGHNIVFGPGKFAPSTQTGRHLLAHELTHVVQQTGERGVVQRQASSNVDVEREEIVKATKSTGDLKSKARSIVLPMLTRYFPEYSPNVTAVEYEEKEPGVKVVVKESKLKGKTTQSAVVTVGSRFVNATSEATLRERIMELGESLLASGLIAIPDPQASAGTNVLWKMIHDKFPKKGRRLAGSSYDAKLPGLLTEFKAVRIQVGKTVVESGAPKLYFGKAFLALTDAEKEAKIGQELAKVDKWSVENFRIFKEDLADEDITARIRGLSSSKLAEFRDKVTDPVVKEYADSLITTSTPMEQGLTKRAGGGLTVDVGNVTVVIEPDEFNVRGITRPVTDYEIPLARIPAPPPDRQGNVNNFVPPARQIITIRTRYPAAHPPDQASAYGLGTTPQDIAREATTLRYHEGGHGLRFLKLIVDANSRRPYPPTLNVPNGTPARTYNQLSTDFVNARQAFVNEVTNGRRVALRDIDCVGITIDDFNRQNRIRERPLCR